MGCFTISPLTYRKFTMLNVGEKRTKRTVTVCFQPDSVLDCKKTTWFSNLTELKWHLLACWWLPADRSQQHATTQLLSPPQVSLCGSWMDCHSPPQQKHSICEGCSEALVWSHLPCILLSSCAGLSWSNCKYRDHCVNTYKHNMIQYVYSRPLPCTEVLKIPMSRLIAMVSYPEHLWMVTWVSSRVVKVDFIRVLQDTKGVEQTQKMCLRIVLEPCSLTWIL